MNACAHPYHLLELARHRLVTQSGTSTINIKAAGTLHPLKINLLMAIRTDLKYLIERELGVPIAQQGLKMYTTGPNGEWRWIPSGKVLATAGIKAGSKILLLIKDKAES